MTPEEKKEKTRAYNKVYKAAHKAEVSSYNKRYRLYNLERLTSKNKEYQEQYRAENKEKISAAQKEYRLEHKEEAQAYSKQYRLSNKDILKVKNKEYHKTYAEAHKDDPKYKAEKKAHYAKWLDEHREENAIRCKLYRSQHKEEQAAYRKAYYESIKDSLTVKAHKKAYQQANAEHIRNRRRPYMRKWAADRLRNDPNYRLLSNLRKRVYNSVKHGFKSAHTMELVGCSIDEVKSHLESQFKEGMSWDNYGKWHIDHIRPCASFDLTKEAEQRACFHYSNLQPLWAVENLSKGDKYVQAN